MDTICREPIQNVPQIVFLKNGSWHTRRYDEVLSTIVSPIPMQACFLFSKNEIILLRVISSQDQLFQISTIFQQIPIYSKNIKLSLWKVE